MSDGNQAAPDNGNRAAPKTEDRPSPTLAVVGERGPQGQTVCETCPHGIWQSTDNEVRVFCRVMHDFTWSAKQKNPIKLCDGPFLE